MPIVESESMTVIRLTDAETDILRELVEFLRPDSPKAPKLLSPSQERFLEDLSYNL